MKYWTLMLLAGLLTSAACTGDKPPGDDDDDTEPGDDDDDDDDDGVDSGITDDSGTPPGGFTPTHVGFDFQGIVRGDGTIDAFVDPTSGSDVPALMIFQFVSIDYLQSGVQDDSCLAFIEFMPPPAPLAAADGAVLFASYETTASGFTDFDCATKVSDPALWSTLEDGFTDAHIGMGLGVMSEFLLGALGPDTLADVDFMNGLLAGYIGLNGLGPDSNTTTAPGEYGTPPSPFGFVGVDLSLAMAIELDGNAPAVDGNNYVLADVSANIPGDPLPDLYFDFIPLYFLVLDGLDLGGLDAQ